MGNVFALLALKQNGVVMTEELKEQLEEAAVATSKAYSQIKSMGSSAAGSNATANAELHEMPTGGGNNFILHLSFPSMEGHRALSRCRCNWSFCQRLMPTQLSKISWLRRPKKPKTRRTINCRKKCASWNPS